MAAPAPPALRQAAIRLTAAGLGATIAGPLGAALGHMLGPLIAGEAERLLDSLGSGAGGTLANIGAAYCYDQLCQLRPAPDLEAVVRDALGQALAQLRHPDHDATWFDNWATRLDPRQAPLAPEVLHPLRDHLAPAARPADPAAHQRALDDLFRATLERLDLEARALALASTSLNVPHRPLPEPLLAYLTLHLPAQLEARFEDVLTDPANERAYKRVILRNTTATLLFQRQLAEALEHGLLTPQQAGEARPAEYAEKVVELAEQAPQLAALVEQGDLAAAEQLQEREALALRARDARAWFDLGRVRELRFDLPRAIDAYSQAWELERTFEFGFAYAYACQKQLRFPTAIAVYESLRPLALDRSHLAMTLNNLGALYSDTQRMREAEAAYGEALEKYRALAQANPEAYLPNVAATLNNLGNLYRATQRMREAEAAYGEALEKYRALAQANPEAYLPNVAGTLNNLGNLYSATQRMREAEAAYGEALEKYRALAQVNPEAYLPNVAATLNNLGLLYSDTQRMREAGQAYGEALEKYSALAQANPEAYLPDVAMTLKNLGAFYSVTQRMREAEQAYGEALKKYRALAQANPEAYLPNVAGTLNNLGLLYSNTQRMREAEAAYGEALEKYRALAQANPEAYLPNAAGTLNNLGNLYRATQRMREAEQAYGEALEKYRALAQANPEAYLPDVAMTLNNLGLLYSATQRMREAEAACSEAEAILTPLWRAQPELHGNRMARIVALLGLLRSDRALLERALAAAYDPALKRAIESAVDGLPDLHPPPPQPVPIPPTPRSPPRTSTLMAKEQDRSAIREVRPASRRILDSAAGACVGWTVPLRLSGRSPDTETG